MSNKRFKPSPEQTLIAQRRVARRLALTACYQWQMTNDQFQDIYTYYQEDSEQKKELAKSDINFFKAAVSSVLKEHKELETIYAQYSELDLDNLEPIIRSALLLSAWELRTHPEVPYKVVINEWVNLSKKFGGEQSHVYVNGMMKHLVDQLRPLEVADDQ